MIEESIRVGRGKAERGRRSEGSMGTFHVGCRVENIAKRSSGADVPKLLVDTGSEITWIPAATLEKIGVKREKKDLVFVMANGQKITRSVGFALIHVGDAFTVDEVVFAEPGDLSLLGARTRGGLNLAVDSARKRLVAAGPLPAAAGGKGG
jgi:predicted aspartyl protease